MPREAAVTYDQVAEVANQLHAHGVDSPSAALIRAELARQAAPGAPVGSPNTVQKHLEQWRLHGRPSGRAGAFPQLPTQLDAAIKRELHLVASNARKELEDRLAQVQLEIADLVRSGEDAEAHIDKLAEQLASRTTERDSISGELAACRRNLENTQVAFAAAKEGVADDIEQARAGQQAAERRTIAAEVHLENMRNAKQAVEMQMGELREEVGRLRSELQEAIKRLEKECSRAAAAEATGEVWRDQVHLLRDVLRAAGKDQVRQPA